MKVLIDTCVIVDALQSRPMFCDNARKIILLAADRKFEVYITANSSTDIFYLTRKDKHNSQAAREVLQKLFEILGVLDTFAADCKAAVKSDTADYEDAVMIETAYRTGIDVIVTRNIKDYKNSKVRVMEPAEFLKEDLDGQT